MMRVRRRHDKSGGRPADHPPVRTGPAHLLHQLGVNLRSATPLGIVGAGGVRSYLLNASRVLEFGVVTVVLLVFAAVTAVELRAIWLRRAVS